MIYQTDNIIHVFFWFFDTRKNKKRKFFFFDSHFGYWFKRFVNNWNRLIIFVFPLSVIINKSIDEKKNQILCSIYNNNQPKCLLRRKYIIKTIDKSNNKSLKRAIKWYYIFSSWKSFFFRLFFGFQTHRHTQWSMPNINGINSTSILWLKRT